MRTPAESTPLAPSCQDNFIKECRNVTELLPKKTRAVSRNSALKRIGQAGFEPTTPCTPCKCATRLRYCPKTKRMVPTGTTSGRSIEEESVDVNTFFAAKAP